MMSASCIALSRAVNVEEEAICPLNAQLLASEIVVA